MNRVGMLKLYLKLFKNTYILPTLMLRSGPSLTKCFVYQFKYTYIYVYCFIRKNMRFLFTKQYKISIANYLTVYCVLGASRTDYVFSISLRLHYIVVIYKNIPKIY